MKPASISKNLINQLTRCLILYLGIWCLCGAAQAVQVDSDKLSVAVFSLINTPPQPTAVPDQEIDEQTPFTLQLNAIDANTPANLLSFTLISGPAGLTVSEHGVLRWTPTEEQGPSTSSVVVRVIDDGGLSADLEFKITVREVNTPPQMVPFTDYVLGRPNPPVHSIMVLDAIDLDFPRNRLDFRLVAGPRGLTVRTEGRLVAGPNGVEIVMQGFVDWSPEYDQAASTNLVVVSVVDNGVPALKWTTVFKIIVLDNEPPRLVDTSIQAGVLKLSVIGYLNPGSILESSDDLSHWAKEMDLPDYPAVPMLELPAPPESTKRFYRIRR